MRMNYKRGFAGLTYHRPKTLDQALALYVRPNMRVVAGGTDLFPAETGRDLTGELLDITAIPALSVITQIDKGLRIGATARWADILSADLPPCFDGLKQAACEVGSVQIQNRATIAGNLCNASPAADGVPPLLTLDARVELASTSGTRELLLSEFILGARKTSLRQDEILTAILVPESGQFGSSSFQKLGARKYLVISIAMVAVQLRLSSGIIKRAAIAVGSCSPVARRLPEFETTLIGMNVKDPDKWQDSLRDVIQQTLSPIDDIRADSEYRQKAVATLINDGIEKASGS